MAAMRDSWSDLLDVVREVDVSTDLRERVERHRRAMGELDMPRRRHQFAAVASVTAVLGVVAVVLVILAIAAHSRQHGTPQERPTLPVASSIAGAPLAAPGELSGFLLYVPYGRAGCVLHRFDLSTQRDSTVAPLAAQCSYLPNFTAARDGRAVAWLGDTTHGLHLYEMGGRVLNIGPGNERTTDYPDAATIGPVFSPNSQEVAYCRKLAAPGRVEWVVLDARSGRVLETLPTCTAAFTANGIAILSHDGLTVGGERVSPIEGGPPDVGHAYQIAATPDGHRIAVVSKTTDTRHRVIGGISIYSLDGKLLSQHTLRGRLDWPDGTLVLNFAVMRLSPHANSAMFWYGDISRLASFAQPGPFDLGLGKDAAEPARLVTFSPDGRYAAMGRQAESLALGFGQPAEPPPPQDAIVFNADSFQPVVRLPIHTTMLAWIATG
jgi:hypothetical protein